MSRAEVCEQTDLLRLRAFGVYASESAMRRALDGGRCRSLAHVRGTLDHSIKVYEGEQRL